MDRPREATGDAVDANAASTDRYVILEKLGAGAMGEVYAAYDRRLDRRVALKTLRTENEHYRERLIREAHAMARLSHPNVAAVFDTGVIDGKLFLAMEFVEGGTLKALQKAGARPWRETLRLYLDAGRGLAAAHAAGLVHRDFKPDNVLVSAAGQVKVTDFGIARAVGEVGLPPRESGEPARKPPPSERTKSVSIDSTITEEGALLGTPAYMAPEQWFGERVDERSDQFAFAVSLYDALYGERPFGSAPVAVATSDATLSSTSAKGGNDLVNAILAGKIREAPRGSAVPLHVRRVLARALAAEREGRYPSMQALLADLVRDPAQRWRRAAVAAGAVAVVAASAAGAARVATSRQARLCAGGDVEAAEVWNEEAAKTVGRSLLATGVPYAADTWRRTQAAIDRYMSQWTRAYRQTCEATRVNQAQSEQAMTLRMACLEQRRDGVRALVQVLSAADAEVASKALQALTDLTDLERCKDVASLNAVAQEPSDPAALAEIGAIKKELATVTANLEAGKAAAARDRVESLVTRARSAGYAPLLAEVLLASARAKHGAGAARGSSIDEAIEAELAADEGRDDATRVQAATSLIIWTRDEGRYPEAEQWSRVTKAALGRSGDDPKGTADWLRALDRLRYDQGRYKEAAEYAQKALDTAKRAGLEERQVAEFERDLAEADADLGKNEEASRLVAEADDTIVRVMGDEHPARVHFLESRAYIAGEGGDERQAFEYDRQAIELAERVAPGDSHLQVDYTNACTDLESFGDYAKALTYCRKAIAGVLRIFGADSMDARCTRSSTGDALLGLRRYDEAIAEYTAAITSHEAAGIEHEGCFVQSLLGIGKAQLLAMRPREAVAPLERALALSPSAESESAEHQTGAAELRFTLAQALWGVGTRTPRVVELARAAEEIDTRAGRAESAREIAEWVAMHRAR